MAKFQVFFKTTGESPVPVEADDVCCVGDGAVQFVDSRGRTTKILSNVSSVTRIDDQIPDKELILSTINTTGEKAAWPCQATYPIQHADAVGGEGCKATTSEIKP